MLYTQHFFLKVRCRFRSYEIDLPAHHQVGHGLSGSSGHIKHVDEFASAQHGAAVCDLFDLLQFVSDEDDRLAVGPKFPDDIQQELDLLGREHGGRFVKNKYLRLAVEHF